MSTHAGRTISGRGTSGRVRWRGCAAALTALLTSTLLIATPVTAYADPRTPADQVAEPATADEAKQAWIDAAHESEMFGERVLDAEAAVEKASGRVKQAAAELTAADRKVEAADRKVEAAQRKVDAAQRAVDAADAVVTERQQAVDAFTDASFRGANTSTLSAFLTATSPEDFLDSASALELVAADNDKLLVQAERATERAHTARAEAAEVRSEATAARAAATKVRASAAAAKKRADGARSAAVAAREQLDTDRKTLDEKIAHYQRAYARLSDADRSDAVAADEQANAEASTVDLSVLAAQKAPSVAAGIAVEAALSREGLPYVWAATGPDSFDCSGLMMWAWAQAGVTIPRTSYQQADGLPAIPLDELQPGDLITYYNPVHHVAMYIGDGKVIHAPMTGVPVKIVTIDKAGKLPVGRAVNR